MLKSKQLQLMGFEVATYEVQVAAYEVPHIVTILDTLIYLSALRIAAIQAGIAAIHHDDGSGAALCTELRAFGKMRL